MQSIDRAKEAMFKNNTLEELRGYCKIENIAFKPQHRSESLQKMLCSHFDITMDESSPVANVVRAIRPKNSVTPPMNLSSEGIWGGKRYRGKVMKPENELVKADAGFYILANGPYGGQKEGYPIKYGEIQVIPAPIYERLRELERSVKVEREHEGVLDGVKHVDVYTDFEHERKLNISYAVEEGTEHLPASMQEWYQAKGPKWFTTLDDKDLRIVCTKLGIDTHDYNDKGTKKSLPKTSGQLLGEINLFLYGWAELDMEEEVA